MDLRPLTLLLCLGAAACDREPDFDQRYRSEAERLQQSALQMEQDAARDIAQSEKAANAMGAPHASLPAPMEGAGQ